MFCPECGSLVKVDAAGNVRCEKYRCAYEGPLSGKDGSASTLFSDPTTGKTVDLSRATASGEEKSLDHLGPGQTGGHREDTKRRVGVVGPSCVGCGSGNTVTAAVQKTSLQNYICRSCGKSWTERD